MFGVWCGFLLALVLTQFADLMDSRTEAVGL
jgi:hypothetical protein